MFFVFDKSCIFHIKGLSPFDHNVIHQGAIVPVTLQMNFFPLHFQTDHTALHAASAGTIIDIDREFDSIGIPYRETFTFMLFIARCRTGTIIGNRIIAERRMNVTAKPEVDLVFGFFSDETTGDLFKFM